jgi:molybdate transport system regulatory protein
MKPTAKPAAPEAPRRWLGRLNLATPAGALAGERRIRLLEAIAAEGSITRAAKAVPLSYKAAWDALAALNNLAERPLVERSAGGRQGGGTRLTDAGRELVALYRAVEREQQRTLAHIEPMAAQGEGAVQLQARMHAQLRRLAVRSSARNQFAGRVARLLPGPISAEVTIALDDATQIVAGVTRESARLLALAPGAAVLALVKASSVLLAVGPAQTSARNALAGTVSRIVKSALGAEVTLALPGARSVTAGITRDSLDRLALAKGKPATALFKASSVILVALD